VKWRPPAPEKPRPCSRCRRRQRIIGKLCGFCFAAYVQRFEEESRKKPCRLKIKEAV